MEADLTDIQRAVLAADARLVEACPGAGKTRAIVARFAMVASASRRAIALLSFTNAAVDEASKRCADTPQITQAPNFIGTFDRFIHRFVTTPVVIRERGKPPRYVDSWNDLAGSHNVMVRYKGVNGSGLALASFSMNEDRTIRYPDDPPFSDEIYLRQLRNAGHMPAELASAAARLVGNLTGAGIYDCEQARLRALRILSDSAYGWLHERLANRFEEIIVDEFQDCATIEHKILNRLASLGIRIVVVADPDQAIYEFRQASPAAYSDYYNSLESTQIVNMDENHRSSPAICSLLSSMRSISPRPIISKRVQDEDVLHADVVYAVVGAHDFARAQFEQLANSLEITPEERLVLASTRAAASALSGRPAVSSDATKQSSRIVRSVATLRHSTDASSRKAAISVIEGVILGSIKFNDEIGKSSREEKLNAAGIEQSELRIIVSRLVDSSTSWTNADEAVSSIRAVLDDALAAIPLEHTPVAVRFKPLDAADWAFWQQAITTSGEQVSVSAAHIHSVKGTERDAVLLEIESEPKGSRPHVIDLWKSDSTSEARRVLYVGASRARRLLVLAVPPKHLDSLREVLDASDIPVEYIIEGE